MTRSEFHSWIAFARVYPMVEVADGPAPKLGDSPPPDVPGLDPAILEGFVNSTPTRRR